MDLISTVQLLNEATSRINEAGKEVYRLGVSRAETERTYRIALAQEMIKLRAESLPATLVSDIARGNVADLKFERDLAADKYRSGLAALEALKVEINALQSIARYQSDI